MVGGKSCAMYKEMYRQFFRLYMDSTGSDTERAKCMFKKIQETEEFPDLKIYPLKWIENIVGTGQIKLWGGKFYGNKY